MDIKLTQINFKSRRLLLPTIFFLSSFLFCFAQINVEENKSSSDSVIYFLQNKNYKPLVFELNEDSLKDLLSSIGNNKYKLLVFYSWWCGPCKIQLNKILSELDGAKTQLLLINTDKKGDYYYTNKYLDKIRYYHSTFRVDKKYGKRPIKRLENFIKHICTDCDYKKMGFPSYILYDYNNDIVFKNTYEDKNVIEKLFNLLK